MTTYKRILGGLVCLLIACFHAASVRADKPVAQTVEQAYPGLASGMLKKATMVPMEKGNLLATEGIEIRESELDAKLEKADPNIREQLRKNLFFILEQEAMGALLVKEARSSTGAIKDLSDEELIQAYLDKKFRDIHVSDDGAKAFYEANKEMVGGLPFEQVKATIIQVMTQQKKQDAFAAYLQGLGGNADIRVNKEWVKAQYALSKDNPVDKARMSGKPTMVEFGAKGCVPCDMMQPILDNLKKKYPENLNVVFVHVGENQVLGARYGIRSIPVQVFFDRNGQEVSRHVGFYAENEVMKELAKLGVK